MMQHIYNEQKSSMATSGKWNLYLNYFKTEVCQPDDNPPVGMFWEQERRNC